MPPSARSSFSFSRVSVEALLLGVARGRLRRAQHLLELAQPLDRGRDGLPVGERAAEPARIDVILRAALRGVGDCVLRLPFRADEQDAAALGDRVAHRLQGAVHHRHRLGEIEDVDVVAGPEDVLGHLRIPAVGLMSEMHASFQKLAHRIVRKRHCLLRLIRRGPKSHGRCSAGAPDGVKPGSACEMGGYITRSNRADARQTANRGLSPPAANMRTRTEREFASDVPAFRCPSPGSS